MLSFVLISDRFSEPIAKAAKGESYSDDDAFELMSFQVDQWRKKAVGNHTLAQCQTWEADPSSRPPTWAILLILRAETVRSLLLKPFFFPKSDIETTKNHIRSATELVYDVCHVLYTLDITSDIYRKQHPYYQHILASAASLAFLLIAFIQHNRSTVLAGLAPDLVESLGNSFEMASSLTLGYCKKSKSARRLAKRMSVMREILLDLGILKNPATGGRGDSGTVEQGCVANTARSIRRMSANQQMSNNCRPTSEHMPPFSHRPSFGEPGPVSTAFSEYDMQMSWADSLRLQWPIGDVNNMFSESIF
jgi:hypothetical protein